MQGSNMKISAHFGLQNFDLNLKLAWLLFSDIPNILRLLELFECRPSTWGPELFIKKIKCMYWSVTEYFRNF